NQRVGVNHLECASGRHEIVGGRAEGFAGGKHEDGTQTLAASHQAVTHGLMQARGRERFCRHQRIEPLVDFRAAPREIVFNRFRLRHSSISSKGEGAYPPASSLSKISTRRSASS